MKKRTTSFTVVTAGFVLLNAPVFASPPQAENYAVEVDAIPVTAGVNPGINYSTGFEPGEGFSLGYISNSGGTPAGCGGVANPCWGHTTSTSCPVTTGGQTSCTPSLTTPTIESAHPVSGAQHLRLTHDPSTRTNQSDPVNGPEFALGVAARYPRIADRLARPVAPNTVSVDIAISSAGGMNYRIEPLSPSQGNTASSVLFLNDGTIHVLDNACTPGSTGFQPTGFLWDTTGAYKNLTIAMDPCGPGPCGPGTGGYGDSGRIDYYYDGNLIYTGSVFGGTNLEELLIYGDNFPGSFMDVDNVVLSSLDDCPPAVGACCDTNGTDTGCTDYVLQDACMGADKVWTENGDCASVQCACIPDCFGATCGDDGCGDTCGSCDDGNLCNGLETCNANRTCDAGTPLICNDGNACNGFENCEPSSGCVAGTQVNCDDGIDCTVDACTEPDGACTHDDSNCAIPTVSHWGLIVLALALLVAAKVYFGWRLHSQP